MDVRYVLTDAMAKAGFEREKLDKLPVAVFKALHEAWENDDENEMECVLKAEGLTLEDVIW